MNHGAALPTFGRALLLLGLVVVLLVAGSTAAWAATLAEASGLRFGENGRITRIVLDLNRSLSFSTQVLAAPDRLAIDLAAVDWNLDAARTAGPRGLARGYEIAAREDGARLVVRMAAPVRVVNALILPPSRDSSFHRLVVDVVAGAAAPVTSVRPAAGPPPAAEPSALPIPATRPQVVAAAPVVGAASGHAKPRARSAEKPVIVLDPGHGGVDPGAISADGLKEKDLVLEMALELRTLIERSGRYRVELTRDDDEFIRLRDRIAKSRALGGQVFISLHADSLRLTELRGASIYTLSEQASDEEAEKFAALENKADVLSGADLSQHDAVVATILIDLAQRDTNNKSIAFADILAEELAGVTSLVKRHRRFAGFAVLKSPDVPSVLLELGYLSNPDDARNLAQPDYRAKLGQAIVRALDQYFAVPRT